MQNFTQKSTTRFEMDVTANAGDMLYCSIPYETGWHVTIDGEAVEVCRTEDGLIGVTLPEGTHKLTLRFLPGYFVYACILSAASVLLLIAIVWFQRSCRKRGVTLRGLCAAAAGDPQDEAETDKTAEAAEAEETARMQRACEILFSGADAGHEQDPQPDAAHTENPPDAE